MKLTRHGEEDDLLVGPLFRGIVVDGDATGGNVTALLGPWDVPRTVSEAILRHCPIHRYLLEDHVTGKRVTWLESSHVGQIISVG